MSQDSHQAIPMGDSIYGGRIETSGHLRRQNVPQSTQYPTSQGQSVFSDGSGPLFNMYVEAAEQEDNKMIDLWQKDRDCIVVFTGLLSATVAALTSVSIQDLRPGPQDNSEFYLANIYRLLADPNVSRASILAAPAKPPPFSPPKYAIWVNSLWFLSLAISLTCALLATLLQQWARRYLTVTQRPRYSPHERARTRAFLAEPKTVETLPTLLDISLFLFSGLLVFLFNIHRTVFSIVVGWVELLVGMYGCITLVPIFRPDSPYYTPLSSSALRAYTGVSYGVFGILRFITLSRYLSQTTSERFDNLMDTYRERLWWGVVKTAQETASASSAEIDRRVLRRTFDALDEDHELEEFFGCIPGFCSSEVVDDPKGILAEMDDRGLSFAFTRFWHHTLTSSSFSERIKTKRLTTCVKAADSARLPSAIYSILGYNFDGGMDGVLRSVEIGLSLGSRGNRKNEGSALCAQGIVAGIIASMPEERDYRWKALVMGQLYVSEDVLRDYLAHGDSVLLGNLIHITRQFFHSYLDLDRNDHILLALSDILRAISGFDIQNTLPGLQNDFCALWNKIILEAWKNPANEIHIFILRYIRHIYVALHQGTDSAPTAFSASTDDYDDLLYQRSSYPLCKIPGHASHIHDPVVGAPEKTVHASSAILPNVLHPDPVLTTISPSAGHVTPAHAHPTP
ncbi:hypothetical protein BJV78DRAFT_1285896 [Lactifluus subvellereus]|nr:hypothetical protein BJV78DRAFT_1285896 [Lactifluus subvellereus]